MRNAFPEAAPGGRADLPAEAERALAHMAAWLGTCLTAVYLHGSAAAGRLRPRSDIDLLAVVEAPLPDALRAGLTADLMAVSGRHPFDAQGRRPLEIVIVRRTDLDPLPYPARAEFVYGEWLREAFEGGAAPMAEANPEFTLLLAQARAEAVPLLGPPLPDLMADIPLGAIRRAIGDLLPALVGSAEGDERNVLLTLARMWRTLSTGEFVSKDAAAAWAVPRLPVGAAGTLALARRAHLQGSAVDPELLKADVGGAIDELRRRILAAL